MMAPKSTFLSVPYKVLFFAVVFLHPVYTISNGGAAAGITVAAILSIVLSIIFLLLIGCGAATFFLVLRCRRARTPQMFVQSPQKPLTPDQVPMLAPPQDPFSDAAAPTNTYPYVYAQNLDSGGYAPNARYSDPYRPAVSYSSVGLNAYQKDGHMNAPVVPDPSEKVILLSPGPPPMPVPNCES
ncbi:hypothetical protein MVEN_00851200 [Mycena venus]|uniref:Uncharacterized protein n=1 Tax=Mycena venus TaxID=2733690 RepID=A0A8H6YHF3_9AGAR|nr:hypothetical protein MVEN_00851200 [Mycena venus]